MYHEFKLPIHYNTKKVVLKDTIKDDLEMISFKQDASSCLYNTLINPKSKFANETLKLWSEYYTTDTLFLKDFQNLIKEFNSLKALDCDLLNKVNDNWCTIHKKEGFKEKYQFVEWDYFEPLNKNPHFLQLMSVYNLISPVMSLVLPIVFLIVPFFLLKLQGITITLAKYIEVLKKILVAIPLGQLLKLKDMSWDKRVYALVTCGLYLFQIYQNCLFCYKFHKNLYGMHEYLNCFKEYLTKTEYLIEEFLSMIDNKKSFECFKNNLILEKRSITNIKNELEELTEYRLKPKNIMEIGKSMKIFYLFHCDNYYKSVMSYSFGFNGFIENLNDISTELKNKTIATCDFSNKYCKMNKAYFAPLKNKTPVKNNISLKKNMIITGPNASGKTTILKTVLFNLILSQQLGVGFYEEAKIKPFMHIHCYLNIPDTSCRDSLFQAEARRCKEIIDALDENKDDSHFCIFDELYSGTNPTEAVKSANGYLKYLCEKDNLKFMLTTHYYEVCTEKDKTNNFNMKVIIDDNEDFVYSYTLEKGLSTIKGGLKVLKDLNYPKEIIEYVKKEN